MSGNPSSQGQLCRSKAIGDKADDLTASPIFGLQWLVNAPRFRVVTIGQDGYPVLLVTVDPRAFALHKLWISAHKNRDPIKRQRDHKQALVVAQLCHTYLGLQFDKDDLQALPTSLRKGIEVIAEATEGEYLDQEADIPSRNW